MLDNIIMLLLRYYSFRSRYYHGYQSQTQNRNPGSAKLLVEKRDGSDTPVLCFTLKRNHITQRKTICEKLASLPLSLDIFPLMLLNFLRVNLQCSLHCICFVKRLVENLSLLSTEVFHRNVREIK